MFLCPAKKAQDDIEIIYTTYNIFLRGVQVSWESKLRQNKLKVAFQWTLNQSGFLIHVKWFVEMKDLWKTEPDLGLLQHPRWSVPAVKYYHKALHLGCCSSPRSASDNVVITISQHIQNAGTIRAVLFRHIQGYSYIQEHSGIFSHVQVYWGTLKHIEAYSGVIEAYWAIIRHIRNPT